MAVFAPPPHMREIKIPILLFIKLNMWPPGSKTDHPSLRDCVSQQGVCRAATVSASIRTLSLGLLESEVPSGGCRVPTPTQTPPPPRCGDWPSDPCVLNLIPDIFPPSLSAARWHCRGLAKDNMMKPAAWAPAQGNISPLKASPSRAGVSRTPLLFPSPWRRASVRCTFGLRGALILEQTVWSRTQKPADEWNWDQDHFLFSCFQDRRRHSNTLMTALHPNKCTFWVVCHPTNNLATSFLTQIVNGVILYFYPDSDISFLSQMGH